MNKKELKKMSKKELEKLLNQQRNYFKIITSVLILKLTLNIIMFVFFESKLDWWSFTLLFIILINNVFIPKSIKQAKEELSNRNKRKKK